GALVLIFGILGRQCCYFGIVCKTSIELDGISGHLPAGHLVVDIRLHCCLDYSMGTVREGGTR
ncbi:hypothetical protein NPIL_474761, partial [Nephila pilipes]